MYYITLLSEIDLFSFKMLQKEKTLLKLLKCVLLKCILGDIRRKTHFQNF